ncbi:MAG TPA: thiamine-phosphate kinase [Rhodocyclaceae bacterium]|nr:thiamine-phosphate kinase [Rhodocyclaceae bacterium]
MPGENLSEFQLIDKHFARPTPSAALGPGDDCALLRPTPGLELAVTTDMLVAGTHFLPDTDPRNLGWKALAVNVSDLAAMGAKPRWALLAGSLPEADEAWIAAFAEGFFACAAAYGVDLVGGDTTRGPLNLCITAMGEVAPGQALRRDGARPGDDIWVSGRPGLAALGLAHLKGKVELPEPWLRLCVAALEKPRPRVALGNALRGVASAAIDVSDGLLADLGHIAERSKLAAAVQLVQLPHLPKGIDRALALDCQLAGGDDYELCFTAAPEQHLAIGKIAADLELPLWHIGTIQAPGAAFTLEDWNAVAGEAGSVTVYDPDGKPVEFDHRGYDHFG